MMGLFTISGSGARVIGPVLLAKVYSEEGPQMTFILFICYVFFGVLILVAFYRRMVPYSVYETKVLSVSTKDHGPPKHVSVNEDQ